MKPLLHLQKLLLAFWQEEAGQDLVEYSLLIACIGLASAGLLSATGLQQANVWSALNSALVRATAAAS